MLANLSKNYKQAVLLNLDEDNQMHILGAIPLDQASNSIDLESVSNDSDKKMFKVRKNRSNSSRRLRKLVNLKSVRSLSSASKKSVKSIDSISLDNSDNQKLFINLSDNSSHKQQIAKLVKSEDSLSLDNSLENLSDDGFMNAYCRSLGYATDNCRKWAGYDAKSKSTNIASAKSDSDNDNKSVSSFTDSDDSRDGDDDTDSNSALSEYLMQLNMFTKMGKGLKNMEKKAKNVRDMGKKYYPMADQAFAAVAPQNHAKYAPKLEKGYKAFNTQANKMGGWNTVDKAANTMQAMGLLVL